MDDFSSIDVCTHRRCIWADHSQSGIHVKSIARSSVKNTTKYFCFDSMKGSARILTRTMHIVIYLEARTLCNVHYCTSTGSSMKQAYLSTRMYDQKCLCALSVFIQCQQHTILGVLYASQQWDISSAGATPHWIHLLLPMFHSDEFPLRQSRILVLQFLSSFSGCSVA